MISIEANMIINSLTTKEKKTTISWSQHEKAAANQKKLADQIESDNQFDFEIIEIEQSKHIKILKLSNHFLHNDDMFYYINLSYKLC